MSHGEEEEEETEETEGQDEVGATKPQASRSSTSSTSSAAAAGSVAEREANRRRSLNGREFSETKDVKETSQTVVKSFTTGDYFGEQALVAPDCIRSADIIAKTVLTCYEFQRQDFNWLLSGTVVVQKIERMIMARQDAVWDLMGMNSVLKLLTPTQKTQLEQRCRPKFFTMGQEVWIKGDLPRHAVLIDSGVFKFQKQHRQPRPSVSSPLHLGPPPPPCFYAGTFVGEIDALLDNKPHQTSLVAAEEGQAMLITQDDLLDFFANAPGVLLAMLHTQFIMPCKEADEKKQAEEEEGRRAKDRFGALAENCGGEGGEGGEEVGGKGGGSATDERSDPSSSRSAKEE